jgi:hypothetical protein
MNPVSYRILFGLALVIGFAGRAAADSKCSSVHTELPEAFKCVDGTSVPIVVK